MTVSVMPPAHHSAVGAQSAGMIRAGVYGAESHWAGCGGGGDGLHTRAIGVGHQDEQQKRNSNKGCEEVARGFGIEGGKSHIVFLSSSRLLHERMEFVVHQLYAEDCISQVAWQLALRASLPCCARKCKSHIGYPSMPGANASLHPAINCGGRDAFASFAYGASVSGRGLWWRCPLLG